MSNIAELFVDCRCTLGEGPIWHPTRNEIFWFDIIEQKLFCANQDGQVINTWSFDEPVAAAAIIDNDQLLLATASKLAKFSIASGEQEMVTPLEADNASTRSNDSRVNPAGGFWVGTMGLTAQKGAGSVYQYRAGKLDKLFGDISIPNSTCFSPDGKTAYWTDTEVGIIRKCEIDSDTGLPVGEWQDHINMPDHRGAPDGAVIDSEGYLWSARWGGSCVIRYAPDGTIDQTIEVPAPNVTCPAFGGEDLKTLYITTARQGLNEEQLAERPQSGSVFSIRVDVAGLEETSVVL